MKIPQPPALVYRKPGLGTAERDAAFVGNATGFRFDSKESTCSNPNYENLVFAENKLGLDIRNVPGDIQLKLINPVFDTNVEDFSDPKGLLKTEPVSEAE